MFSYLKLAPSNLSSRKISQTKKNAQIWDQKCWIWVFLGWNLQKMDCHIWNQHPWICLIGKYREIIRMPKLDTKSAFFGYFRARILKNYCHIWNQIPRICIIPKFCRKTKMPKFGTKNAVFGYSWAGILKKTIVIFEIRPVYS